MGLDTRTLFFRTCDQQRINSAYSASQTNLYIIYRNVDVFQKLNTKGTDQTAQISRLAGWCINSFVNIKQNQVSHDSLDYHAAAYLYLHRAEYADRSRHK